MWRLEQVGLTLNDRAAELTALSRHAEGPIVNHDLLDGTLTAIRQATDELWQCSRTTVPPMLRPDELIEFEAEAQATSASSDALLRACDDLLASVDTVVERGMCSRQALALVQEATIVGIGPDPR